jgi:hypothetical protein
VPDPLLILGAMGVAFAVAGVIAGLVGWPRQHAHAAWLGAGWILGIAVGFLLGCWMLGVRPHWPPRDDQDRLLALVVPAALVIELLAVFPTVPRWLVWPLRVALLAAGTRVLLHGTSYITDVAGPGTSEWSSSLAWLIFSGLAALAATVWALLSLLSRRAPGPSLPICLAGVSAGSAITVMLSGYASGGQVGLPLAAALMGATVAALVLNRSSPRTGPPGIAIVGLFSLLVIGRFFGELTSGHAIVLFCAPVLGWLTELPRVRRLPSWARGLARVILVAAVVSVVVFRAQRKFDEDFHSPSATGSQELSPEDYMNFGK